MEYGDITYTLGVGLKYSTSKEVEKPASLVKYYGLSKYSIDALTNSYLYGSHPFDLNDVLDSSVELLKLSKKPSKKQYQKLYSELSSFSEHVTFDDFYNQDNGKEFLNQYYQLITAKTGIVSLGSNEYSPLMWPHYSAERGFAVSFDTKKLEQSIQQGFEQINIEPEKTYIGLKKINYVEELVPLILSETPYNNYKVSTLILLNIKHISWNYENEWRLLFSHEWMGIPFSKVSLQNDWQAYVDNRKAFYSDDSISSITIGKNFFFNGLYEIVKEEIEQNSDNATVYRLKDDVVLTDSEITEKCSHLKLLDYITNSLNDKCWMSCHQIVQENDVTKIVRAKQKLSITKLNSNSFKVTRLSTYLN